MNKIFNIGDRCDAYASTRIAWLAVAMANRLARGGECQRIVVRGWDDTYAVAVSPCANMATVMPCGSDGMPRSGRMTRERGFGLLDSEARQHGLRAVSDLCAKVARRSRLIVQAEH